jgi:NodT family efflux transporter outer membrane factor (OMF) lipoprotein
MLVVLASILLLGGCELGPDFVRPTPPATDRYTKEPMLSATVTADEVSQRFTAGAAIPADWWTLFKSATLDALMQQAIANNPTLAAAEASLRQSQDNLRAGYGLFFPHIDADIAGSRERTTSIQQGLHTPSSIFNVLTLSGTIGYTLDIFGGERRTVEGLAAQVDAQRYASKAAYITLSANVVDTSIARAAYTAQMHATEQIIELETQQLQSTEAQVRAGTAAFSNVLSVRSLIAANRANLAPLQQQIEHAQHLLATLQGTLPSDAKLADLDPRPLSLPNDLPVSLPSDLVRQRPDILAAEAQLHLASANIGVATAAMFPSFSLSGTYGMAGSSLGNLSAAAGKFWSIGPSISIPLFQGGTLWYQRKAAIDAYQQAQANYRQTVLTAFAQVADALKALEHDAQALQAQSEAQQTAREALALVQTNYRAGLANYLDVLVADVQFHNATIARIQAVALREQDTVALFVALGGGWWNAPPAPAAAVAAP